MAIIGTAGHVDHGKTALVRALTGQDTDRLKEEKERGISIDLGFAYLELGGGERAGIVDVPGHERFIRNMLAGAHGIDLVLLVIAADDGVMPQTEEHLDIAHLLGVGRGVVAITKIDLVDACRVAWVREEAEILLAGTALEGAPMVAVSAVTGAGIDTLRCVLENSLRAMPRRSTSGHFRLPIDRAFAVRGRGTVVTGTAIVGTVRPGDTLRLLPGGEEVRVRNVQVHGRAVERAVGGQRVALNLAGADLAQVGRGQVACSPFFDQVSCRFDAWVEVRAATGKGLKNHAGIRLYVGTAEVLGRLVWLDGRGAVAAGDGGYAQIVLRSPVHLVRGDRFILRNETAQRTVGGGTVVHPLARPHRRGEENVVVRLEQLRGASAAGSVVRSLLEMEDGLAPDLGWLAQAVAIDPAEVKAAVVAEPSLRPLPSASEPTAAATVEAWERLKQAVLEALGAYHNAEPLAAGMEMESLRSRVAPRLTPKAFRAFADSLERAGAVVREQSIVRLPSHRAVLQRHEAAIAARAEALIAAGGLTPPSVKEIEESLGVSRPALLPILKQLEREGRIVRTDADLCFAAVALEKARALVRAHVQTHGEIDAATLRDLLGSSRKFSIALLDYFDRTGFTMRIGDVRKLRRD